MVCGRDLERILMDEIVFFVVNIVARHLNKSIFEN